MTRPRRGQLLPVSVLASMATAWVLGVACAADPVPEPVLRVATSGDYRPFSVRDPDGERSGFDIAVAEAFAADRGLRLEWVPFRWPELRAAMERGDFDLAMSGVTVRTDRSVAGRFSVPVARTGAVLLVPGEVAGTSLRDTLAALDRAGLRIAVNAGGHLERVTRETFRAAEVRAIPDNEAVPAALGAGEVDAVVTDTLEAPSWLAELPGARLVGPLTRDWKAYWSPADREALAAELDAWLLEREADGWLAARREAWFASSMAPTATATEALLAACDERLALMPQVAAFKRANGLAVVDASREARVLEAARQGVERAAAARGVATPARVRIDAFYRAQIDAAVAVQEAVLAGDDAARAPAYDLTTELRPALLRIGERMARLLVQVAEDGPAPDALAARVEAALARHALPPARVQAIARSLEALGQPAP